MRQNSERDLLAAVADPLFGFAPVPFEQRRLKNGQKKPFQFHEFCFTKVGLCESSKTANFSRRENEPISDLLFRVTKCPHVWETLLCQSRLTRL